MSFYSTTVLADSPKRYYRLDEAGYELADSSGNKSHAAASATGVTYGVGSLVGNSDTCVTLDGTIGHAIAPWWNIPSGSSAFSIEAWVKIAAYPGSNYVVMSLGDWANTSGCYIAINSTGHPFCGQHNATAVTAAGAISTGAAHHLVVTYDGTNFVLYVDGSSAGTAALATNIVNPLVYIGAVQGPSIFLAGSIGQVAVYNAKLSSTQVSNHFNGTGSGYDAVVLGDTPVAYWKMTDSANGSTTITDSSTSAQNGTQAAGMAQASGLLTSDPDTAYFFTGAPATAPATGLATVNAAWSMECWVKIGGNPEVSTAVLMAFGTWAPNQAAYLGITTSGDLQFALDGVAGVTDGAALTLGTIYHVVGTWDGTTLKLYKNASLVGTATPAALNIGSTNVWLGNVSGQTFNYVGVLDEAAIYNVALSSTQITTHYNAGTSPVNNITLATSIVEVETVSASIQGVTLAKPLPQYNLWIRSNATLGFVDVLNDYLAAVCELRFNSVSALAVTVDPYSPHIGNLMLQSGTDYVNGLILTRDNQDGNGPQLLFSGPIIDIAADFDAQRNPPYTFLVTAESDDVVLEDRVCLPVLNYPYSNDILTFDTPLRYYRLGESSGTVAVDASGHNNGTYAGSGVTYAVAPGIDDSDTAVTLDGAHGTVTFPVSGLPTGNSTWSIAAWVNLASAPASTAVVAMFGTWASTKSAAHIAIDTSGYAYAASYAADTTHYPVNICDGQWHHLVAKYDGTILTLYVDGLPRETATPGTLTIGSTQAAIGSSGSSSYWLPGSVDEVEVLSVAYADARVLHNYNVGLNRFAEGPAYDARTGIASTIMQQYVMYNAGSLALPERQTPLLALAADPLLGGTVDESVRFHNLLLTMQNISLRSSSEFGFVVRQTLNTSSNNLLLTIFQPRNQESAAAFSLEIGNLAKFSYQASGVNANTAYSGGSGSGTTRPIVKHLHVSSIARSHKRREKFYNDSQYTTTRDLHTQAGAHLAEDKDIVVVGFEAIDTQSCAFLRDYHLGDLVSVVINIPNQPNVIVQDIVRQVTITLKAGQRDIIQPVIGAVGSVHPLSAKHAVNKALKVTTKRIDQLQNNQ